MQHRQEVFFCRYWLNLNTSLTTERLSQRLALLTKSFIRRIFKKKKNFHCNHYALTVVVTRNVYSLSVMVTRNHYSYWLNLHGTLTRSILSQKMSSLVSNMDIKCSSIPIDYAVTCIFVTLRSTSHNSSKIKTWTHKRSITLITIL